MAGFYRRYRRAESNRFLLGSLASGRRSISEHLFPVIRNRASVTMTERAHGKVKSNLDATFRASSRRWFTGWGAGFRCHGRIAKDSKHSRIGERVGLGFGHGDGNAALRTRKCLTRQTMGCVDSMSLVANDYRETHFFPAPAKLCPTLLLNSELDPEFRPDLASSCHDLYRF